MKQTIFIVFFVYSIILFDKNTSQREIFRPKGIEYYACDNSGTKKIKEWRVSVTNYCTELASFLFFFLLSLLYCVWRCDVYKFQQHFELIICIQVCVAVPTEFELDTSTKSTRFGINLCDISIHLLTKNKAEWHRITCILQNHWNERRIARKIQF